MKTRLSQAFTLALVLSLATSICGRPVVSAQTDAPETVTGSEVELSASPIVTDTLDATLTFTETLTATFNFTETLNPSVTLTTTVEADVEQPAPTSPAEEQPEGWTSGETSVSELGADDRANLLGVPLEVIEWEKSQQDQDNTKLAASYSYPSSLDWRDFGGEDWTTPVRDQSGCNSCVAFATVGAIESRMEIAERNPDLDADLSEAHLYFCGSGSTCGQGWYPSAAMDVARDTGIVDEACYPYSDYDQACSVCPDWESRVTKISNWVGVTDVAEMKQTLADEGPFEATMVVYVDFYFYTGGVYEYTWGRLVGGHAVTIVGYDDNEGYWIARNSWGTDWGENGWFKIAYGECWIDSYAYVPIVDAPISSFQVVTNVSPSEGGTVVSAPFVCTEEGCEEGTEVELTAVAQDGYQFVGWDGDVTGTSESIRVVVDSDKSVTAIFSKVACTGCIERTFVPVVVSCPSS